MFVTDAPPVDYDTLNELACHTTEWLRGAREEAVRERRRWHLRQLAITRLLDERGQIDDSLAAQDGVSTRDARRTRRTASKLGNLPNIADAAARGELSDQQLAELADPDLPGDDAHGAEQGPAWSPDDLADQRRKRAKPTTADAKARHEARALRFWWRQGRGMLDGRFSLPDVAGAMFEDVLNQMIERMKPAKGEPWDTRDHRGADALMALIRNHEGEAPIPVPPPRLVVHVPPDGPATVAGIPIADETLEALRAEALVEPVHVDRHGEPVAVGRARSALPEKAKRVVRQRDGKCRYPGCDYRVGLEIHHLWPKSWGGADAIWNLASVCPIHHVRLAPQGDLLLLGNPNNPAGLSLVHRDDLPALAELAAAEARAGPTAA